MENEEYFGQNNEDITIEKYVGDKKDGLYLDIGAGHPQTYSNTYHFYLKGWKGIALDPLPIYKELWETMRKKDLFLPYAVTNYDGKVDMCFAATVGSFLGDDYIKQGDKEVYTVSCITIPTIIQQYPEYCDKCDFVSLDVETNEDKILSVCDFNIFKPKLMIIEYEIKHIDQRPKWEHWLLPYYAMVEIVNSNAFYFRKEKLS